MVLQQRSMRLGSPLLIALFVALLHALALLWLLAGAHAASAPVSAPARPSLLDSEATRRAVRMATREPLLSERAATASQDPGRLSAQQRMGQEIAQAATGDCLKGEYAGGGMGLLSLPFWLAAEVRGKCRR
jgi:hypothetical protein